MGDVPEASSELSAQIVGRETELAKLDEFLGLGGSPRVLVLMGAPGIGKSALWEEATSMASDRGMRVLSARGSGAETQLSSAGLIDLLDEVGREELAALPPPQLQALEVALFRAQPSDAAREPQAVNLGFLNALRSLAGSEPLLVAIDDLQWLDHASAETLVFCARRLEGAQVVFLLARRTGPSPPLERAFEQTAVDHVQVAPLSFGATRRLLSQRFALNPPRHVLRRVFDFTLGNPLFTVEVGRTLAARGLPEIGDDIPVPDEVEDLLGTRVAQLPPPVRRLLLALALNADLRVSQLTTLADTLTVEEAVDAGVLVLDGDRARPSHPLLAAAAKTQAEAAERRELHLELATVAGDEELRVLHLALATRVPDAELATRLADAAAQASARGAAQQAVVLAEHALRLTPAEQAERRERLLELAGYLEVAGERQRVTDLLMPELGSFPKRDRIRAWLRLAEGGAIRSIYDTEDYFDRALAESEDDPALRAHVLAKKAIHAGPACVWRIREAEQWSLDALAEADRGGPVLERLALHGLGWARALRGLPIDDVCERFRAASDAATHITDSPEPVEGLRLLWRGHVEQARTILSRFLTLADARGEEVSYALQRLNLCDLELRTGGWDAASRLLDEWESADRQLLIRATFERSRGLLAAGRGLADEAERWASSALAGAEPGGYRWQVLEALRARGIAALLAEEPGRAAESLRTVWEHMEREGVDEPGAFPVAPELVEALADLGELDEARRVTGRLRELADQQDHPWGDASAKRCAALVQLAEGYDEQAAADLAEAAEAYGELGFRFDRPRSLLSLGRAQRRVKKWGAARESLERAAAEFAELGSAGWAERARADLDRVGGRRPRTSGELTPTEQRVAELAVDGLANKEIAQSLFVTVRTVEVHLKHVYEKLGIRSRTQLARRLSERS